MTPTSAAAPSGGIFEKLGWRAERRPEPGFAHTLGAGAAAFAVFAVVALVFEITDDDPTLPGVGLNLALFLVAMFLGMQMAGPMRTAAVTAIVLTVPLIWFFLFLGDGGGGEGDTRVVYLATIVSYLVLYVLVWTRGRAILLGLALLFLFTWVVSEIDNSGSQVPFGNQVSQSADIPFGGTSDPFGDTSSDDNSTETSTAALVIGLIYLGAAGALDRRKLAGAATPFIAVGAIATVIGATVLGFDESVLAGGLTLALSGAAVGLVGGLGMDRRFSTWFGVLMVVLGLFIVVGDTVDSNLGAAGFFAGLALVLAAAATFAAPRLHEFVDGDINAGKTSDSS